MLYPVKIYGGNGALKQVISSEQLSRVHWQVFEEREARTSQSIPVRGRGRKWAKSLGLLSGK